MTSPAVIDTDLGLRSEFVYLALSMMLSRHSNSVLPEVCSFLRPDQIFTLSATYGGQEVYVPTPLELSTELYAALVLYYNGVHGYPLPAVQKKLRLTNQQMTKVRARIERYQKWIADNHIDLSTVVRGEIWANPRPPPM